MHLQTCREATLHDGGKWRNRGLGASTCAMSTVHSAPFHSSFSSPTLPELAYLKSTVHDNAAGRVIMNRHDPTCISFADPVLQLASSNKVDKRRPHLCCRCDLISLDL